jgi:hypothetical protein
MKIGCANVGVYVYNCYILLVNYSLYQYEVTFLFYLMTNFGLKSALSDMNLITSACFGIPFAKKTCPILSHQACEVHFLQASSSSVLFLI